MTKTVLVPVADGTEEVEAIAMVDLLRRAGARVTVASVGDVAITAARGTRILADARLTDLAGQTFDLIAVPGGIPGAEHLRDSSALTAMLREQADAGRWLAAICAAPVVVLHHHGLISGPATGHPAFSDRLPDQSAVGDPVVIHGRVATSRGVGTVIPFSLCLVELLFGPEKRRELAESIVAA